MNQSPEPSAESAGQVADRSPATVAARRAALRLYLVPLLVVSLLVVTWLVFCWSLESDDDPLTLLRDMREPDRATWQKAYVLAELLQHPRNQALRENAALCRELAGILDEQFGSVGDDPPRRRFRVYLCRALGSFHLPDGLPSLLRAAELSHAQGHDDVHCAALEALALLAGNAGPDKLSHDPRCMTVLLDGSRVASGPGAASDRDRVASTATFALGVVGGPVAVERLRELLDDRRLDVRYNAATGLARHGAVAATPVLLEMLDSDNQLSLINGPNTAALAHRRDLLVSNGIRAAVQLVAANPQADRHALLDALQRLGDAPEIPAPLRDAARTAQAELRKQSSGRTHPGSL